MRKNTRSLLALRQTQIIDFPADKGRWIVLTTQNPRELAGITQQYARTANEKDWWSWEGWNGIPGQTWESLDKSGIAEHSLKLMQKASATLPARIKRPNRASPAVTGAVWNIPAVMANLPLSAITRARTKLPPKNIKIGLAFSESVDCESVAVPMAKIAKAIHAYTLAGGVVSLTVYNLGFICESSVGARGVIISCKIPTSDAAALATMLSPVNFRNISGPLLTAFSDYPRDAIPVPELHDCPMPDVLMAGGVGEDIHKALEGVIKALEIEA